MLKLSDIQRIINNKYFECEKRKNYFCRERQTFKILEAHSNIPKVFSGIERSANWAKYKNEIQTKIYETAKKLFVIGRNDFVYIALEGEEEGEKKERKNVLIIMEDQAC